MKAEKTLWERMRKVAVEVFLLEDARPPQLSACGQPGGMCFLGSESFASPILGCFLHVLRFSPSFLSVV